uniref:Peptidase A2 domain-containing protein n=1 Tax=Angiostrongylus cantonensis TaxID=6313 RepID=A0A0K0D0R0_ANGCA
MVSAWHFLQIYDQMKEPKIRQCLRRCHPTVLDAYDKDSNDLGAFIMKFREERLKKITLQGKAEGKLSLEQLNHSETRLHQAMLQFPECFTKVPMIYLHAQINGVDVLAFLDTGAQMSIISATAVEKCKMTDAVDRRFRVTASGVGGMRSSAGRILACQSIY